MFSKQGRILLMISIMTVPIGVFAAPIASSYKSIASITSVGPGTLECPAGEIPVAIAGIGMDHLGNYTLTEQMCADPLTGTFPVASKSGTVERTPIPDRSTAPFSLR